MTVDEPQVVPAAGLADEVVLWVRLASGDRFTGTLGGLSGPVYSFNGWIDFMAAMSSLRAGGADDLAVRLP